MKFSSDLFVGLMSGTSIDGVDVALVEINQQHCKMIDSLNYDIDHDIKTQLSSLSSPLVQRNSLTQNRIEQMATLDTRMGHIFAKAVNALLQKNKLKPSDICAVGSHGQTLRHRPDQAFPFTLQIGDPNVIAETTGITTIADFRRMDIAAGGQGAPLAPAFHHAVLRSKEKDRIILNLGGIANITYLPKDNSKDVIGFDTGPANTLLDHWFKQHHPSSNDDFDRDAKFAQTGIVHQELLKHLLNDEYFTKTYPKSTGREYFSLNWLNQIIEKNGLFISTKNGQATLIELTAITIANAIDKIVTDDYQLLACGGGMHNAYLLQKISERLNIAVEKTNDFGIDGDYLEAMTFAWLAYRRVNELSGNLPSVTGAKSERILGALYLGGAGQNC